MYNTKDTKWQQYNFHIIYKMTMTDVRLQHCHYLETQSWRSALQERKKNHFLTSNDKKVVLLENVLKSGIKKKPKHHVHFTIHKKRKRERGESSLSLLTPPSLALGGNVKINFILFSGLEQESEFIVGRELKKKNETHTSN